ncbi:lipopolysaccharide biosynthesis protein [Sphingomonas solaris]|uniref:Lipopolysaccharide biosynthesis protein n=1 Tax=Alterirhizorhabdus solaris TaxID=2529389 RepID=A0A558R6P8_9SPHN|nr:lipopolysaccharide biosynthesis protein [Sphingomonas solaris]TVV74992.1 lipopolysaccharide biosynthesis protein [Sphingomonas solaris]
MADEAGANSTGRGGFGARVRDAVLWRSGSQIVAQLVMWSATFFVIRLLAPADYGVFAMTQSILVMFSLLNGYGFASALIQADEIDDRQIRQVFGLLLLLNGGVALLQLLLAPLAADYYNQPIITNMLRVQALLYLSTPFVALPTALLSRAMDFRKQAKVNFLSALAGAVTALSLALLGFGVWTLVIAPLVLFWTRAIGMTVAARLLVLPSFRFKGAGATVRFGGAMTLSQLLWFVQTQADVFIGGRVLDPHLLGLYTTSLFLAQILASKFIPPLNEVAFTAYARLQHDRAAIASSFETAMRIIMLVALPFYAGLAITAEPLVHAVLGEKWMEAVPIVRVLALAMPFVTMQILFAPAATALGRPRVQVYAAAAGAVVMPLAFLMAVRQGPVGMAWAWVAAFPLVLLYTAAIAMPIIGVTVRALARAIAPGLIASALMAVVVMLADRTLAFDSPLARLGALVAIGGVSYTAVVLVIARSTIADIRWLVLRRGQPEPA